MKITKKLFCVAAVFLIFGTMMSKANADVILTPDDEFYKEHREECKYNNQRMYYVEGENGGAVLYENPESDVIALEYKNGDKVQIFYLYTAPDNSVWGYAQRIKFTGNKREFTDGWIKMSNLILIYDNISFLEEHEHEFENYEKGTYTVNASENNPVTVWKYPGGDIYTTTNSSDFLDYIDAVYTDGNNNVWGYVNMGFPLRQVWVCLTNPHAVDKSDFPPPAAPEKDNAAQYIAIGASVAAIIIITLLIIRIIYGKKRNEA